MTIKTYVTKVTAYNLELDDQQFYLGVEVPYGFLEDLDLKVNEVLKWEIDTETQTAKISKERIIINTEE